MRKLLSIFVPAVLALLAAGDVGARLSFLPARPGGARPTPPRATPAVPPASSAVAACQAMIAGSSGRLLADVRDALGVCLARGVRCLVDETGSSACCEEAALVCQPDILRIAAATRLFRETVRAPGGACGKLPVEDLLAAQGLGFDVSACARLTPPVAVDDHARFADCLQLLLTKDVLHQVGLLDIPRAPEALVCMGLDDVLGDALGSDPATCEPTPPPSATPTATPEASPPDGTPTPTAPGPMPTPTPSPGTDGCQPRLFGPCQDAPFTGCCQTDRTCAQIIGEEGPGYCVTDPPSSTATPAASATPGPTATAGATATPSATSATPTPGPTHSAAVTPSPGATASPGPTPGPTASPGATGSPGPTASPGPTPVESCSTLTATVAVNYNPTEFPDVAGMTVSVTYPASVSIPGFGAEASVMQRVTNLTGVSGIFSMGDQDTAINVGLVSLSTVVPPGNFVRIVFDCASGAPVPAATSFSCTPDVSTSLGSLVTAACQISLATTP